MKRYIALVTANTAQLGKTVGKSLLSITYQQGYQSSSLHNIFSITFSSYLSDKYPSQIPELAAEESKRTTRYVDHRTVGAVATLRCVEDCIKRTMDIAIR